MRGYPVSAQEGEVFLETARVHWHLARTYVNADDKISAIYAGLCALNFAERASPSPLLARLYGGVALLVGLIPLHLYEIGQYLTLDDRQKDFHLQAALDIFTAIKAAYPVTHLQTDKIDPHFL